jgi:pimeloyl-ACP methyl ester carboxylesterase
MTDVFLESNDGTLLKVERSGAGRPLVVLSGALFPLALWKASLPILSAGREVWLLERRGRSKERPLVATEPEREVEDVLTVLRACGSGVELLGHSSGAILSLQAAEQAAADLQSLVLYEPPVFVHEQDQIAQDLPERLQALIDAGDLTAAVRTFLREGPRVPESELQTLSEQPHFPRLVSELGHTVASDARVQRSFVIDEERLARVRVRTLMLVGGSSPARMRSGGQAIAALLPEARLEELAGQEHAAMRSAPALFAAAVTRFLEATS